MIAGLRATNEALQKQDQLAAASANASIDVTSGTSNGSLDKKDSTSPECFDPLAEHTKDTTASTSVSTVLPISAQIPSSATPSTSTTSAQAEQMRLRKKTQNILARSDSTGSTSGRKFLAPTLSDPQAHRSDKYSQKKKPTSFVSVSGVVSSTVAVTTPTAGRTMLSSGSNSGLSAMTGTAMPSTSQGSSSTATDKTVSENVWK